MLKYNNRQYDTVAHSSIIIKNTKHRMTWTGTAHLTKQADGVTADTF